MLTKEYIFPAKNLRENREDYLFFDIETTGLKKDTTILYLIGCGYYENENFHIFQWFNDDGTSEEKILCEFKSFLTKKSWTLLSFNGESFDIPYLKRHYELNELAEPFYEMDSVDLYKLLRPFKELLGLPGGRQKNWEEYLGLYREDQYDGGKLISIYREYLKTHDEKFLHLLLLHNMEDIHGMESLFPLLSFLDILNGNFICEEKGWEETSEDSPGILFFQCMLPSALPVHFQAFFSDSEIEVSDKKMFIRIPVFLGELKHYYKDYENYFYLPEEDRAIHKSVGCFVEKSHRKKATAKTCYIKKEGVFLPLPSVTNFGNISFPSENIRDTFALYRENWKDKISFLLMDELFLQEPEEINHFLLCHIHYILTECLKKKRAAAKNKR